MTNIRPLAHVDLTGCAEPIYDGGGRKWVARAVDELDRCLVDVRRLATRAILTTHIPNFYLRNWGFREVDSWTAKSIDRGDRVSFMILDLENTPVAARYK